MNRRNFFTRIATAIAVAPILKLTQAQAKPVAPLPVIRPEQDGGLTYLILGAPRTGKTVLSLYLQDTISKRCVVLESDFYSVTRQGREGLVERVTRERNQGGTTIVVARANRVAASESPLVYSERNALMVGYLADWTFLVSHYSMYLRREGVLKLWHCETIKDRFGNKPRRFTYQKCGDQPLVLCAPARAEVPG